MIEVEILIEDDQLIIKLYEPTSQGSCFMGRGNISLKELAEALKKVKDNEQ